MAAIEPPRDVLFTAQPAARPARDGQSTRGHPAPVRSTALAAHLRSSYDVLTTLRPRRRSTEAARWRSSTQRALDKHSSWFQHQPVIPFARPPPDRLSRAFTRCHD